MSFAEHIADLLVARTHLIRQGPTEVALWLGVPDSPSLHIDTSAGTADLVTPSGEVLDSWAFDMLGPVSVTNFVSEWLKDYSDILSRPA